MRIPNHSLFLFSIAATYFCVWLAALEAQAQRIQFPQPSTGVQAPNNFQSPSGLRPVNPNSAMVPINPATQAGIYPSTTYGSPTFDPYSSGAAPSLLSPGGYPNTAAGVGAPGGYPIYNGAPAALPGTGQSAVVGTFPNTTSGYSQPGVYPNSTPSALFPGSSGNTTGGGLFSGIFGSPNGGYGNPAYGNTGGYAQPVYPGQPAYPNGSGFNPNTWNPQGTIFSNGPTYPQFIRLFQGPRFRHAFIWGNEDTDSLMINDSDLSLAFAIPNFLYSTQPLYLLPSFSLHQWAGPREPSTADLPPLAYSAFLDAGWQSDPARILGAELGLRVGMFSDFDTATSESLRVQGRGIGRIRITPRATLKGGVIYLDRNKVKLLPAGGLLWQPNQDTRFDLFFPEPKLAHYLSTVGTMDTWWYVGGYYGGGSWTITRDSGAKDSIDINDLRLVLGLEWGRNDQMREGRRVGFLEVGYVFDRELLYKNSPLDNLDLQDTVMVRAGFGY